MVAMSPVSRPMPARVPIPAGGFRRVLHADLDCFFAAVEELDDPSLAGRPVIVGGNPEGRGVVSTANYLARRFGVHSAMAAALARRLCPQAVFLRPRFPRYRELSQRVMAILAEHVETLEQVSVDEAYGELPPGLPGCRRAEDIALELKRRVRAETGLVISVGVARNKLLAKLASDTSKPDGCLIVRPGCEEAFLRPLPVGRLPGVGPHTRERLARHGLTTVGELSARGPAELHGLFGRTGEWLWRVARGQDDRPVEGEHGPPKSISRERTYERDIADAERAEAELRRLAERVARDAEQEGAFARTVTLKIKWYDFTLTTRQCSLGRPTRAAETIGEAAVALLRAQIAPLLGAERPLRLLGVGLSGLILSGAASRHHNGLVQLRLFDEEEDGTPPASIVETDV
ncbi:MAG TPA: DNA polymerase IV [Ktedonobacterales bacterium]|nr:DNA polymerase IV [Ktedonobacterales bacterium]